MSDISLPPTYYTTREVARRLRVKPETVQEYIRTGYLRGTKPGRCWLISPDDLAEFVRRGKK